jgi:hypothetical protein
MLLTAETAEAKRNAYFGKTNVAPGGINSHSGAR